MLNENQVSRLLKMQEKTKANSARAEIAKRVPIQMAFWSEPLRAVANELTRCSLFSCRDVRKPRRHYSNERLFVLGKGTTVTYTGEELRGRDQDTWLAVVHASRNYPAGNIVVKITSSQICKLNGWPPKQPYYTEIFKSLQRLQATNITITSQRLAKAKACEKAREAGATDEEMAKLWDELEAFDPNTAPDDGDVAGLMLSLVGSKVGFEGQNGVVDDIPQGNLTWSIPLDSEMVSLFARPYLTLVPFEIRKNLSTAAKRLQDYYMSHRKPNDVLISSLAQLLDLDGEFKEQRRTVLNRLQELVDHGVLLSATPAEGRGDVTVHVERAKWTMENDPPSDESDGNRPTSE